MSVRTIRIASYVGCNKIRKFSGADDGLQCTVLERADFAVEIESAIVSSRISAIHRKNNMG